ncbi:hypothetical protein DAPPUDRAFT_245424 [Daphnia pulex]|uniref:Uncharacterized protein n=1 Tax=Daphnia pulex TaxID=6669 RepID=E9GNC0_DAPPU|nr:hypothetical protein DAPPUDRAFT_245424 [Daphnia pulex]|eukprot:EFX79003.1 hypothetical protein DAPPUDRAFT_245424 [Daphnia pulex]
MSLFCTLHPAAAYGDIRPNSCTPRAWSRRDRSKEGKSMASPPKHQQHPSDSPHCNKLVNRLNLATLSLRPRWRVMVEGLQILIFIANHLFSVITRSANLSIMSI